MSLIEKLKWMWDPRTDADKAHAKWDRETPLMKRTATLYVHIIGIDKPFEHQYTVKDFEYLPGDNMRFASNERFFKSELNEYLGTIPKKGIVLEETWYHPDAVSHVVIGESVLEEL